MFDQRFVGFRSAVQRLIGLMLDLVLGGQDEDGPVTSLEYDTVEKRLHCQLVCVVLRTILNLVLSGTIQTIVSPSKEDNNSTAANVKCAPNVSLNQVFSQDSVAYLTLKMIQERRLVSFCLLNLEQLLSLWRTQSADQVCFVVFIITFRTE